MWRRDVAFITSGEDPIAPVGEFPLLGQGPARDYVAASRGERETEGAVLGKACVQTKAEQRVW